MRPLSTRGHSMAARSLPDMTPMVDVVMVILIFFMASSALVGPELLLRAQIAPEAREREATPTPMIAPAALVVRLSAVSGATLASGMGLRDATVEQMLARIQDRHADLRAGDIPVVVQATPEVPYQRVVDVIAALERAGVRDVAIR